MRCPRRQIMRCTHAGLLMTFVAMTQAFACGDSNDSDATDDDAEIDGSSDGSTLDGSSGGTSSGGAGNAGSDSGAGGTSDGGGAGGAGGGDTTTPWTYSEYCYEWASAYFAHLADCGYRKAREYADFSRQGLRQTCLELGDALQAGRYVFDPAAASSCVEAIEAIEDCSPTPPDVCSSVLQGNVNTGKACSTERSAIVDECRSGFCAAEGNDCKGTCTAPAGEGEVCAPFLTDPPKDPDVCAAGLSCTPGGLEEPGRCYPTVEDGELCGAQAPCRPGADCRDVAGEYRCFRLKLTGEECDDTNECVAMAVCDNGTCSYRVEDEQACIDHNNCPGHDLCAREGLDPGICRGGLLDEDQRCAETEQCVEGLVCDEFRGCIAPVAEGNICTVFNTCEAGTWCTAGFANGTCQAVSGDGESCQGKDLSDSDVLGPYEGACEGALRCMSDGNCHLPGALDAPCRTSVDSCAAGFFCEAGQCVATRDDEEACQTDYQCTSGFCESAICASPAVCTDF